MKFTLFWKIYISILISFLVIVFSTSLIIVNRQISDIEKDELRDNKLLVDLLSKEIEARYYENKWPLESLARLSSHDETLFWFIVRDNDGLIYLADKASFMGARIQDYYPLIAAATDKEYLSINRSQNSAIFVRHLDTGNTRWSFWYGFSLRGVNARKNQFIFLVVAVSLASLGILGIVLFYAIGRFTRPIQGLISGAMIIGSGNLSHRLRPESEDELSQLAVAFNKMAEDLQNTTVSKDYINDIIGSMVDALIVVTPDLRIEKINRSTYALTGYQEHEMIGNPLRQIIATDDQVFYSELQRLQRLEQSHIENYETYFRSKDGKTIPILFNGSAIKDGNGDISHIVCVARDITERIKAEETLRERDLWINTILEASPVAIYSMDQDGIILTWNKGAEHMFGWSKDEVIGRLHPIVPHEERESFRVHRKMIRDGKPILGVELHRRKKDGSPIDISLFAAPVCDSSGTVTGHISVVIDITQQKKMEAEHAALENQLRQAQKMEAVGQLGGGVAHDFNNILSAIVGYAQLSLMKMSSDDPNRQNMEQILASSDRATELTQRLLAFSRKQTVNLIRIDLNKVVSEFEKLLLKLLREDIELKTILTNNELPVMIDRVQIEQVLMNLVTNSRDAMQQAGRIVIETSRIELDQSFIESHGFGRKGIYALIAVTDTGIGIPENIEDKIFEPFFTTKDKGKGTGLGLSMVYGIVKKHEGYITVYSEHGVGTTFNVYLPIAHVHVGAENEKQKEDSHIPARGGTETVLIAEDDPSLRSLTAAALRHFGYAVIESVDGKDAVAKFKESQCSIRLVVLDGIMPKMNGRAAWREIKALSPSVKAIFISGYAEDIFTKDGIPDNEASFIQKPYAPLFLAKRVREVLDE